MEFYYTRCIVCLNDSSKVNIFIIIYDQSKPWLVGVYDLVLITLLTVSILLTF